MSSPTLGRRLQQMSLKTEQALAVALLALILVLTFAQVVARFVFNSPFFWTEELARHSYVWLSFIAAMAAMNDRSHITVELFDARLPPKARLMVNCIGYLAVAIACAVLVAGSWEVLIERSSGRSPALGIPTALLYGIVYLAFVVMAVHAVSAIVQMVSDHRAGRDVEAGTAIPEGAS